MKYLLTCALVLVMVAGISFAGGDQEAEVHELVWFITGEAEFPEGMQPEGFSGGHRAYQVHTFEKENPNIKVTLFLRDVSQGSMTLDSLMAAGKPPDVLTDAAWLFPNFLVPEFALPLEEYMDLSRFQDNMIDLYSRGGHCYALVQDNVSIGFALNLDMLDPIGYELPAQPDWTTVEFDRLSEKLKAVGMHSTVVMNQSFNTWSQMWIHNAGGTMFENNDYSKVTLNSPENVIGLKYWKSLVDRGYAYPRPNECNDDTGIEDFAVAKIFACPLQTGHVTGWVRQALESGALEKAFEYTFVEVPHDPSVEHAPIDGYQSITLGHRSKNEERNKAVAKLVEFQFTDENVDMMSAAWSSTPVIKGFVGTKGMAALPSYQAMLALSQTAPPLDSGRLLPSRRAMYRALTPFSLDYMNGKISAEDLLDVMEIEANKILAE